MIVTAQTADDSRLQAIDSSDQLQLKGHWRMHTPEKLDQLHVETPIDEHVLRLVPPQCDSVPTENPQM
jgi:hypothetical protein